MGAARRRLLIVDDDPEMRGFLDRALRHEYEVTQAADAESAWRLLEEADGSTFDALLSDYELPGISGLELLERVRAASALRDLPVLIISGHGDALRARALDGGADALIAKPFVLSELRRVLSQSIVERSRRG